MATSLNTENVRTIDLKESDGSQAGSPQAGGFRLVVDVEDTADAVLLRAEMPGLSPKDFSVEVAPTRVILRGFKPEERDSQSHGFSNREIEHGSFYRVVSLPAVVDPDAVTAAYKDGVLRMILPKTPDMRARHVSVTTDH